MQIYELFTSVSIKLIFFYFFYLFEYQIVWLIYHELLEFNHSTKEF